MSKRAQRPSKRGLNDAEAPEAPILAFTKRKKSELIDDKRRKTIESANGKGVPKDTEAGSSNQIISAPFRTSRSQPALPTTRATENNKEKGKQPPGNKSSKLVNSDPVGPQNNVNLSKKSKDSNNVNSEPKNLIKAICNPESQQKPLQGRKHVHKSSDNSNTVNSTFDNNPKPGCSINLDSDSDNSSAIEISDSEDSDSETLNIANQGEDNSSKASPDKTENNPVNQHPLNMLQTLIGDNPRQIFKNKFLLSDILLIVLTFALIHNLTYTAMCDTLKTFNLLLCTSVFPVATTYFKKMLNLGMQVHFTCEKCGHYLGTQNDEDQIKTMTCGSCDSVNEIAGRFENEFVLLDVASQIKALLTDKSCKFIFNSPEYDSSQYRDIFDGLKYAEKVHFSLKESWKYLTCTLFCENAPISDDSNTSITPIYLMLNELEFSSRGKNLILAGFWYGKNGKEPQMDVFLKQFVDQMNKLYTEGFEIDIDGVNKKFKVAVLCCCVANEMRCKMQGIQSPGKIYSCSWCLVKGNIEKGIYDDSVYEYNDDYPFHDYALRTESNLKTSCDRYAEGEKDVQRLWGVETISPFNNLHQFDMVGSFIPCHMLLFRQITRQFLNLWLSKTSEGKVYYFGTQNKLEKLDKIISKIKVPNCINTTPVLLSQHENMTPKDLENWLLYVSAPVLKYILPGKHWRHWKCLVYAATTLLQDQIDSIGCAQKLKRVGYALCLFIKYTEELYGKQEMNYNLHQLLHLKMSANNWGPIWIYAPHSFQSSVDKLSKIVKTCEGDPHEIVRNYNISRTIQSIVNNHEINEDVFKLCESIQDYPIAKATCIGKSELIGKSKTYDIIPGLPTNVKYLEYDSIVKDSITYSKKGVNDGQKIDNSYVMLHSKNCAPEKFAQIKNILYSVDEPNEIYVVIKPLHTFADQCCDLKSFTRLILGRNSKVACKISEIKCSAVYVYVDEEFEFITPVPLKHAVINMS